MASMVGDHKGGASGRAPSDLADEIRRIIQELEAVHYPDEELSQAETQEYDEETQREGPDLSHTIHLLKRDIEDATAESVIAIRLLHELMQLRHSELLDLLSRMEQNLQDEISLMERRIRGDIAMLRAERRGSEGSDFEKRNESDQDSKEQGFSR